MTCALPTVPRGGVLSTGIFGRRWSVYGQDFGPHEVLHVYSVDLRRELWVSAEHF